MLGVSTAAYAQADIDPELRIQQLENQLRRLTGQNEELQYRNRQLEERLRAGGAPSAGAAPNVAAAPSVQPDAGYRPTQPSYPIQQGTYPAQPQEQYSPQPQGSYQAQSSYDPQIAAPAPIMQEPPAPPSGGGRRRGDAFDPNQNPNAPGAPRALGGGQMPLSNSGQAAAQPVEPSYGAEPRAQRAPRDASAAPTTGALTTAPPSQTPRDEYDLGIGYMQRRDYALAEETMRNFSQKYPGDPLTGDAQYWLGESYYQRQQYRDAAETFLGVTTKFEKSGKAPDALLRLGQSLAALKEKEAACAAFGEVARKYPRASTGVKQAIDREQKRVKC